MHLRATYLEVRCGVGSLGPALGILLRVDQEHVEQILVGGGMGIAQTVGEADFALNRGLVVGLAAVDVACHFLLYVLHLVVSEEHMAILEQSLLPLVRPGRRPTMFLYLR